MMTRKIILSSIVGAMLSGCFGENEVRSVMEETSRELKVGLFRFTDGDETQLKDAKAKEESSFTAHFKEESSFTAHFAEKNI